MCSLTCLFELTSEAQRNNVKKNGKKGKLAPSVWLRTMHLKIETVFDSNNWKIWHKNLRNFLKVWQRADNRWQGSKIYVAKSSVTSIMVFQSVPLVLFVTDEINFIVLLQIYFHNLCFHVFFSYSTNCITFKALDLIDA